MKDNTDKYIKEMLKGVKKDLPSEDFTKNIMSQIVMEESLIIKPKSSFFSDYKFAIVFSITFISIFLMVFFISDYNQFTILNKTDFTWLKLSYIQIIRDYFSENIKFSSLNLVIIVSIFTLFSLDTILQRIRINSPNL